MSITTSILMTHSHDIDLQISMDIIRESITEQLDQMEDVINEQMMDVRMKAILATFFASRRHEKKFLRRDYITLARVLTIEDVGTFRSTYSKYLQADNRWLASVGVGLSTAAFDASRTRTAKIEAATVTRRVRKWIMRSTVPTWDTASDNDAQDSESEAEADSDADM